MTVVGDVDPVEIVGKLKKYCHTEILTVGPSKEEVKKDATENKDNESKGDNNIDELIKLYNNYYPHCTQHYRVYSAEDNPNSCVIC